MKYFTKITTDVKQEGISRIGLPQGDFPWKLLRLMNPHPMENRLRKCSTAHHICKMPSLPFYINCKNPKFFPGAFIASLGKSIGRGGAVFNSDF